MIKQEYLDTAASLVFPLPGSRDKIIGRWHFFTDEQIEAEIAFYIWARDNYYRPGDRPNELNNEYKKRRRAMRKIVPNFEGSPEARSLRKKVA